MTRRYQHVIWDWNGTLLDDTWLCVEVLNGILARRGRGPISEEEYRRNFCFPVVRFYEYLGFDTRRDSFEAVSEEFIGDYEARWLEECSLHADAADVLERGTRSGLTHSVLSAAKQEALDHGLRHFGLHHHFLGRVGADDIFARGKVDNGRRWMERLRWAPEEVVLVGDTLHDHEVAQAIGTDCVLMSHGHHDARRLERAGAPVAHSLGELADWLA